MKVIAFGASNSRNSINKALAAHAASLLDGAQPELLDLNDFEIPMFSEDREAEIGQPQVAKNFLAKIEAADAVVVSFAEHNGSYTVAYKNLFDWASRIKREVFQGKPVIFLATSPGPGGAASVLQSAVNSAPFFGADVKGSLSVPSFFDNFDITAGALTNPNIKQQLTLTMDQLPYPFDKSETTANVEIYHTVHNQTETRAPIRAMTVLNLDGVETVVAAYTCTPLVTIPAEQLTDGAHVKGKTIAELGYGNTPLDVIHFTAPNKHHQMEDFVLVLHKERSADLIRVADLANANRAEGLSTPEMWAQAGVPTRSVPLAGVLQAADQDEQFIATLKRNLTTGDIDLVSFRKGAYFRLNDFISEYNFSDYNYVPEQEMFRNFQNLLKSDSGYSDLAR